jgi:hypothetical protein
VASAPSEKSAFTSANRENAKEGDSNDLEDPEEDDDEEDDPDDAEEDEPPRASTPKSKNLSSINVQMTWTPLVKVPVDTPLQSPDPPAPLVSVKYPSKHVYTNPFSSGLTIWIWFFTPLLVLPPPPGRSATAPGEGPVVTSNHARSNAGTFNIFFEPRYILNGCSKDFDTFQ